MTARVAIVDPEQGRTDAEAWNLEFNILEVRPDTTLVELAGTPRSVERVLEAWGFTPGAFPQYFTLDVVSRALSVIEESDGADEHGELIGELRALTAYLATR